MENEIWKDIEGYEGYQVSNMGRVKSLNYNHTGKEKIKKQLKLPNGYLQVNLWKNRKRKQFLVHRLVACAFIPNPLNLPQVNHRNERKTENFVENLEWCDRKYNCNYGTRNQRVVEKNSKPVIQYDQDGNFIREWPSTQEIERSLGYSHTGISFCCCGKYKQAYGYIWRYKEKEVA